MVKQVLTAIVVASAAQIVFAEAPTAKTVAPYEAYTRPDNYTNDQLWDEYFNLPSGVSAYDYDDFAEKGMVFTYEVSDPEILTVTNCGCDTTKSYRRNNITWALTPLKAGTTTLTVTCHYTDPESGNTTDVVATREFNVKPIDENLFTPIKPNLYNVGGIRGTTAQKPSLYFDNFFNKAQGWDPAYWEAAGITWGMDTDNPAIVSAVETSINGTYAMFSPTVEPVTGSATLIAWVSVNGNRVESKYVLDQYLVKCFDDVLNTTITTKTDTITILGNDKKGNGDFDISIVKLPSRGFVNEVVAKDDWGRETRALAYTLVNTEGIDNWTTDPFIYRISVKDSEGNILESDDATVNVTLRHNPTISKIFEFVPAPGQFVNSRGFTDPTVIIGKGGSEGSSSVPSTSGMISLGSFGGYVVVGFDAPIPNDPRNPYGVDFTIGGNAFKAAVSGYWSEPGAVMVMRDDNGNGLPDDTWYELAGSDYWFSTTRRNITMTYEDPGYTTRYSVPFTTSDGVKGALTTNRFHSQSYFPSEANYPDAKAVDGKLTYSGSLIRGVYDRRTPNYIESYRPNAFGYCDNHATNGDITNPRNPYFAENGEDPTDGFDISWAVDAEGNYVDLDHIDFVKIYNSVDEICGWLGESSTEVAGFSMSRPDPNQTLPGDYYLNYAGITQLLVLEGQTCQYEGVAFHNGRLMKDLEAHWSVDDEEIGTIDQNGLFTAKKTGTTTVRFWATDLAPVDTFDVEVVTIDGVLIDREGNGSNANAGMTVLVGEKHWINAEGTVAGQQKTRYVYDSYLWSSSNDSIVEVDNQGNFLAKAVGEVVLTVKSASNTDLSATIKVNVIDVPEVKQYNNYLYVEDRWLSQEELNATTFASSEIFDASFNGGNILCRKVVNIELTKVEPAEYADMFYMKDNVLYNNLVKGDYREYVLTFEGTLNGVTTTAEVPFFHTSNYNTIAPPTVHEEATIEVDRTEKVGTLDLAEVFVVTGPAALYTSQYRLVEAEYPENVTVELSEDGILTVSYTGEDEPEGLTIGVEGRVERAKQECSKAPAIEPVSPSWQASTVTVKITEQEVSGVNGALADGLIRIYPNPAVYSFTLNISEPTAIRLYSAAGTMIVDTVLAPGEAVDVSSLTAGVYFVVLPDGSALKLVKE